MKTLFNRIIGKKEKKCCCDVQSFQNQKPNEQLPSTETVSPGLNCNSVIQKSFSYDDIQNRAYYIWIETGRNDAELNWIQALDELNKNEDSL